MPKKIPPIQLEPVPEIVTAEWIQERFTISHRSIEKLIATDVIKPFRPGGIKVDRFHARQVLLAMEGPESVRGRTFLPVRSLNGDAELDWEEFDAVDDL